MFKVSIYKPAVFWLVVFILFVPHLSLAQSQNQWPNFQGDPARTGFSKSSLPSEAQILWQWTVGQLKNLNIDQFQTNWPVIHNNKVFFATSEVMALELETGKLLWRYKDETTDFYPHGLAVNEDKIFVTVNDSGMIKEMTEGHLYALKEESGEFLWKFKAQGSISHSLPVSAEGKVFIGDDSATIYAINVSDGRVNWQKQLEQDGDIHASPAYADGLLFITTEGDARYQGLPGEMHESHSSAYALNPKTGEIVWQFPIDYVAEKTNLIHSTPAVAQGVVYFGVENGYFYAVSKDAGELVWKTQLVKEGNNLIGSSGSAGLGLGKVFVGTWVNEFFALNQKTGEKVWEFPFEGQGTDSSPVVADDKVCFGVHDGYFYCLDAETGEEVWKEKLGGTSAALADDVLIVSNVLVGAESDGDTPVLLAFSEKNKGATQKIKERFRSNSYVWLIIGFGLGLLFFGVYKLFESKKRGVRTKN